MTLLKPNLVWCNSIVVVILSQNDWNAAFKVKITTEIQNFTDCSLDDKKSSSYEDTVQTLIEILNLCCDLDLEHSNPIFFHGMIMKLT